MDLYDLFEYRGAIHVHSAYSDGSGRMPEIVAAAQKAGLDFLILTDHNTLQAREEGWEGWHDGLLVVVGQEITNRYGHTLAMGTAREINHRQPVGGIIKDIVAQQGLAFLAHPHGIYKPLFSVKDHSWRDWTVNSYTGLELWSYMFDWVHKLKYYRFLRHYQDPQKQIRGPFRQTVEKWDRLCQEGRTVAIGAVDAHAKRYPLLPFVVFPYEDLFRTVRTRVLIRGPLSGTASDDIPRLLSAMREGNCFISYDLLCDSTGTRFGSTDGNLLMGDERPFQGPTDLVAQLPVEAELTVLKDGRPLSTATATSLAFCAEEAGVYRVEAYHDGKPWIYTNPIYLRPGV